MSLLESISSKTLQLIDVPEPTNYRVKFTQFGYDNAEALRDRAGTTQVDVMFDRVCDTTEFHAVGAPVLDLYVEGLDADGDWKGVVLRALESGDFVDETVMFHNFANRPLGLLPRLEQQ